MAAGPDQAIENPPVLVTGASGQIGVFVIPRLLAAGFTVAAVSRKGKPAGYPAFEQVEWLTEQAWQIPYSIRVDSINLLA